MDKDTAYLITELRDALNECERNVREGNSQYYEGDAAEIRRRGTELEGKLKQLALDAFEQEHL